MISASAFAPIRQFHWTTVLLLAVVSAFVMFALAAEWLVPQDPFRQNLLARLRPPGATVGGTTYLLGTDELGRDLLSRIILGARVSLLVALVSIAVSGVIGTLLGMVAAYRGGITEALIMRAADIVLSIPALLFAIIIVALLGPGTLNVIAVLAITRWPRYARVAHAQTLVVSNTSYVRLARYMGAGPLRNIATHVLPNIAGPIVVVATLEFGIMVLFEAGLSFLGFGVQAPTPSWGSMLAVGRNYMETAWWLVTVPGICLFLLVVTVNILGDRLRDRLDPRLR